ncbi:RdgB/HAM1 family non-canonical purine NTP pyrophosphatase [Desulfurobacterium indicum]|uniref:dITP/XTP pyrophosphatase n=1 Tax=Desulfurobacterium indicum TaxID=1914305 RepID=A0A1R1MJX3_9BACT|nr:RdgB/HAM1 family non-canonical purine NTP pyrophosphatase [Desulfurobacterium indicum]OMH40063.1 non-canonical purine NTP pyrophosphatase, RdgB/HAM1 family [Desulfurobacterium indicum]
MKIVIASKNRHKIEEISKKLNMLGIKFLSLLDFDVLEAPETGNTFLENVYQKSSFYAEKLNMPVLSDDSGLVVEALGGLPGVHSSRFAGENATDEENLNKLVELLLHKGISESPAAFVCFMMITFPDKKGFWSEGTLKGKVITEPRGSGGFGYDPIFVPDGDTRTLAEYPMEEKNAISHRGKALEKIVKLLKEKLK